MAKKIPSAKEVKKYSKEAQDAINKIVADERKKQLEEDTKKDKELVEEYYNLKDKILELIGSSGKSKHKDNKRLKIIANLPARRPATPRGYATAAERITQGTTVAKKESQPALAVIVEEKEGKVEARKLAPRKKKAAPKKKQR